MAGRHRSERLNELFRRELSRLLLTEIKDPRVSGVTVNEVRVTNDLSYATAYVTVDASEDAGAAMEGLQGAAGFIRRELAKGSHLRKIPEFRFENDTIRDHVSRIDELLRQVREADAAAGEEVDARGED
ncbi:MAG: 30S ribosome-binding factor RbfA [Gemmatimonadota bacterium]